MKTRTLTDVRRRTLCHGNTTLFINDAYETETNVDRYNLRQHRNSFNLLLTSLQLKRFIILKNTLTTPI